MENGLSQEEQLAKAREERLNIVNRYDKGREEGALIDAWDDPNYELYHKTDRYGFIHDSRLTDVRSKADLRRLEAEKTRSLKWAKMIKEWSKYKDTDKLVKRMHKGVPLSVRGAVWSKLLDLEMIKKEQKGKYEEMKNIGRKWSTDVRQIDLDVNRTYRDHDFFRLRYNLRQQQLFHVLVAYSMYNQEIGYCQGMSQVAALLLIYLIDEEDAFWAFSALMTDRKFSMHGFFIPGFPKLMRFQQHHDKILLKFLPKLKKHMEKNYVDSGLYTLKWFFQCFLDRVPFSLSLRIWDIFLIEGECLLFSTAYTILKLHRRQIMKLDMDQILEYLQKGLELNFGYDDDYAIESLEKCTEELKRMKLYDAGPAPTEELPQNPFGLFVEPTLAKEVGLRGSPSDKERRLTKELLERQDTLVTNAHHLAVEGSVTSLDKSIDDVSSIGGIEGSRVSLANTSMTSGADLSTLSSSRKFDNDDDSIRSGRSLISSEARSVQSVRSPRSPTEYRYRSGQMVLSSHSGHSTHSAQSTHSVQSIPSVQSRSQTSSESAMQRVRSRSSSSKLDGHSEQQLDVKPDRSSVYSTKSETGSQNDAIFASPPNSPLSLSSHQARPTRLSVSQSTLREIDPLFSEPVTPKAEIQDAVRIFVPYTAGSTSEHSYHSTSDSVSTQSSANSQIINHQYSPLVNEHSNFMQLRTRTHTSEAKIYLYSGGKGAKSPQNGAISPESEVKSFRDSPMSPQNGAIQFSDVADPNRIKIKVDADDTLSSSPSPRSMVGAQFTYDNQIKYNNPPHTSFFTPKPSLYYPNKPITLDSPDYKDGLL